MIRICKNFDRSNILSLFSNLFRTEKSAERFDLLKIRADPSRSNIVFPIEIRQYKNGFVSVKRMLVLKLPPFFPCRVGKGKRAAISKQTLFSQKRVRCYIVLAL